MSQRDADPPSTFDERCERAARRGAYGLYCAGGDQDDILQEARMGVLKALRDWRPEKGPFEAFAYLCARRQAITAVKTARRGKHQVLNTASSTDEPVGDDTTLTLADIVPDGRGDIARTVIAREQASALIGRLLELTDWERECVLRCLVDGEPYEAVGDTKSVDNAIQRAKLHLAVPGDRLRSRLRAIGQPTWPIDTDLAA